MGQIFTCRYDLYNHRYNFYMRGWDVFTCKNVLCTRSYVFYSHGCNKFLHARMFFTLADTTSIHMFAIYLHGRIFCTLAPYVFYSDGCNVRVWNLFWASVAKLVLWQLMILLQCTLPHMSSIPICVINFYMQECCLHSLIPLLFPWVQCQSLKPVLSQCSQTSFVTVDGWFYYSVHSLICLLFPGCNKFLHGRTFFYTCWYHFYSHARMSFIPMGAMSELFIIIIIKKKGQQCKAGREWYTPYQSEDPSPTIPTYRQKEEKGKESRRL